jgi:hypothetical protein
MPSVKSEHEDGAPVPNDVQIVIFWALTPCCLVDGCVGFVLFPFGKDESVKKSKVVPVLNEELRHEGVWGSRCIDPRVLDLDTSLR